MGRNRIILRNAVATERFASRFARSLPSNALIALFGELGAGKTTFVRGLVAGLGGKGDWVQSPTFTYLRNYPTNPPVNHFDLYRLHTAKDFMALGFAEYLDSQGITIIEWSERIHSLLPPATIRIMLQISSETERVAVIG